MPNIALHWRAEKHRAPVSTGVRLVMQHDINKILAVALVLLVGSASLATQRDTLGDSIAFLVATPQAGKSDIGTGVLLAHDDTPLLATAEHVAKKLSGRSLVVIRAKDGIALQMRLSQLAGTTSPQWRFHSSADLALLALSPEAPLLPQLTSRFLPTTLLRADESAPPREVTLTVVGFPLALGVSGRFSAISRETKTASDLLTALRADTKTPALFFVTQDPSIGGFSGGPVFDTGLPYSSDKAALVIRSRKIELVGIVHGTLSDDTGGKLGMVTPAYQLLKLIQETLAAPNKPLQPTRAAEPNGQRAPTENGPRG